MSKFRAILDTNVIISAFKSSRGASHRVLHHFAQGNFIASISTPLALEYESILLRNHKDLELSGKDITLFIDSVCSLANRCKIFFLWRPVLKDPNDEMILEVAVASKSTFIVTFNKKDFVAAEKFGIVVLSPGEFLKILEVKS